MQLPEFIHKGNLVFHRWLTNIWIYFVSLAVIVSLVFVIMRCSVPEGSDMYHTFYLFGINPVEKNKLQWEISSLIVGIIGVVIFNGLLITAFSSGVERYVERIRDGRKRFWMRNHYVMIGYNHYSSSIIERILGKNTNTRLVVLTSKNVENVRSKIRASLPEEIDNRVIIYSGDGNTEKHVSKLNLERALGVYVMVEGNEWENQYTQSMTLLKEINNYISAHQSVNSGSLLPVNLFINDSSAFNLVQCMDLPVDYLGYRTDDNSLYKQNIDLHIFNFYENWARLLWSYTGRKKDGGYYYDSLDFEPIEGTNKYVHLIIVGFNSMGRALLQEALRICHYPNYDEDACINKSIITIIDPEAETLKDQWNSQYPFVNQIKDISIEFVASTCEREDVRTLLREWSDDERQLLTIAICLSDPDAAMSMAFSLPEELFFHYNNLTLEPKDINEPDKKQKVINNPTRVRILIRQNVKKSISDIISFNGIKYKNVRLFGTYLNGFDEDLFNDDLSICVNGIYLDKSYSKLLLDEFEGVKKIMAIPFDLKFNEWKQNWLDYKKTPETNKMSTRYQIDHYRILLPILERAKSLNEDEYKSLIDLLACAEHRRWIAERSLVGWRQVKESEKRIDSLKIHTCIVPHSKLEKDDLVKDRNVVEFAPVLVDFVNKRKIKND